MNKDNFSFLKDNLKYLGFSESLLLNEDLEKMIREECKDIILYTEVCFDEYSKLEATLYFRRSTQTDMYFFNKYEARLIHDEDEGKNRTHVFFINKGSGITFKESYNLLNGRSVYKKLVDREGKEYYAWLNLDFNAKEDNGNYKVRRFSQRYGYDLEKVLLLYPIRELKTPDTCAGLIRSLQRGNLHLVTFEKLTKQEKMYIEANPQFKTINIFPTALNNMNRVAIQKGFPIPQNTPLPVEEPAENNGNDIPEEEEIEERESILDDHNPHIEEPFENLMEKDLKSKKVTSGTSAKRSYLKKGGRKIY